VCAVLILRRRVREGWLGGTEAGLRHRSEDEADKKKLRYQKKWSLSDGLWFLSFEREPWLFDSCLCEHRNRTDTSFSCEREKTPDVFRERRKKSVTINRPNPFNEVITAFMNLTLTFLGK
jgi:hypothetical protein